MSATAEATTATATAVSTWNIDPAHSSAEFKVRHMMISNVKGTFKGLSGVLELDESEPSRSRIQATVPITTVSTGDDQRDGHLKSADFFDADKFPAMTFQSTGVRRTGAAEYAVIGDLTLHGVTRQASFAVEEISEQNKDPWGNVRIGLTATARINRKDFGLAWNATLETGGVLVGEEVAITLDVQFIRAN